MLFRCTEGETYVLEPLDAMESLAVITLFGRGERSTTETSTGIALFPVPLENAR
jgi:hypothetical protein